MFDATRIESHLSAVGWLIPTSRARDDKFTSWPVVAAAVCFENLSIPEELASQLNDSKKLSAKKREKLFDLIYNSGALIGVGQASAEEIDEIMLTASPKDKEEDNVIVGYGKEKPKRFIKTMFRKNKSYWFIFLGIINI